MYGIYNNDNNRGIIAVIITAGLVVLLGMLALSADVGYMFLVRNQLQNAADAAALAGVAKLIFATQEDAVGEAINYAKMYSAADRHVEASDVDVTFPSNDRITVTIRRTQETVPVGLFFGRVLGLQSVNASAKATARVAPAGEACKFAPWAVIDNVPPYQPHIIGQPFEVVTLKISDQNNEQAPGWFRSLCFPPIRLGKSLCGADTYRENIINGSPCGGSFYQIGDVFNTQTGDMEGPTRQGVTALINQDPGAYYTNDGIMGSVYPEGESPRIVNIPFVTNVDNQSVRATRFGAFFVTGFQKAGQRSEVYGVFIRGLGKKVGSAGDTSFLSVPQLIE